MQVFSSYHRFAAPIIKSILGHIYHQNHTLAVALFPQTLTTIIHFFVTIDLPLLDIAIDGIMQYFLLLSFRVNSRLPWFYLLS